MDEEVEHSPSEFYYPEDLETLDTEIETGSTFYYQKTECHIISNLLTEREGRTVPCCHELGSTSLAGPRARLVSDVFSLQAETLFDMWKPGNGK